MGKTRKPQKALDQLNVALAHIEAFLAIIEPGQTVPESALKTARKAADDARLLSCTITFHLQQLV